MTDTLATGRSYYWRARAQDGANTGPYATPAASTSSRRSSSTCRGWPRRRRMRPSLDLRPTFTLANAPRSGPVGAITYLIELADSDSFANKVATWTAAETPNQTSMVSPVDLSYGKVYYWHARAYDPTTLGPWTNTQAFQMLAEPAPVFTPSPTPAGPAPNDAINLNTGDHPQLAGRRPELAGDDDAHAPRTDAERRARRLRAAELVAGSRAAGLDGRHAVTRCGSC